jgi:hypothetical protein
MQLPLQSSFKQYMRWSSRLSHYEGVTRPCGTPHMVSEVYCPDPTHPRPQSLSYKKIYDKSTSESFSRFPRTYPPFIYHIRADRDYNDLLTLIHQETRIDESYIHELFDFGAIYLQSKPSKSKGPTSVATVPMDRQSDSRIPVTQDTYCRIHVNPRRYFGGYDVSWTDRITSSLIMPHMMIVDKPYDLPMTPTVDNTRENLMYYLDEYSLSIRKSESLLV